MEYAPTMQALAEACGLKSEAAIRYHRKNGLRIKKTPKGYPIKPTLDWLRGNARGKIDSGLILTDHAESAIFSETDIDGMSLEDLRGSLVKAQIEKTRLDSALRQVKLDIEKGKYITQETADGHNLEVIHCFKTNLLALPRRLAQDMIGLNANQMEVTMKKSFRDLLTRLSKM